ncbi:MAG: lysylphosphatidylglycerol synthase transmembrane domain-containing protein [Planctomycetaceae bacterium]|nr:flippase-like domain-containing protein [Planctomycetaceae bacterium]
MNAPRKQRLVKIFLLTGKLALAVVLVALLTQQVHWNDGVDPQTQKLVLGLKTVLAQADWVTLALAVLVMFPSSLVCAFRWRMLLAVQGVPLGPLQAVKLYLLGDLFANVLPGTIGGDAVKAYLVTRATERKGQAILSVLADRAIGLCAVTLLAAVALAWAWGSGQIGWVAAQAPGISLAVISAAMAAAAAMLLSTRLRRLTGLQALYSRPRFASLAATAGQAVRTYRSRPAAVIAAMLYTLVSQAMLIGSIVLIGMSLDLGAAWHRYAVGIPLVEIATAVPVTPGAVGVWEWAGQVFFAGADPNRIFMMVLLWRAVTTACALPGLAVALLGPRIPRAAQMQADLETMPCSGS